MKILRVIIPIYICIYFFFTNNPNFFAMWAYLMSYRSRFLRKEERRNPSSGLPRILSRKPWPNFYSFPVKSREVEESDTLEDRYWNLWKNMVQFH